MLCENLVNAPAVRRLILGALIAVSFGVASPSQAVEAKGCVKFFTAVGAGVGALVGLFGDTPSEEASKSGRSYGSAMAGGAIGGSLGAASGFGLCPTTDPLPTDEGTDLRDVVVGCYDTYLNYMNPVPFANSRDICTVPGNRFIQVSDIGRHRGHQTEIDTFLRKLRFQFDAALKGSKIPPQQVPAVSDFADQLKQCIRTYVDRKRLKYSDHCRVTTTESTEHLWHVSGRRVPCWAVLRASIMLLDQIEAA